MTFTHALSTNNYGPSKFIVSSSAANGTHTTIASALSVASSGDTILIRDGSYTENLTLIAGVNLSAFSGASDSPNVTIIGTLSFAAAGTVTISNIRLQTNGATNILSVTGTAASIVNLKNCFLNCTSNTGINFTTANTSAVITLTDCIMSTTTTGITYFTSSSTGSIQFFNLISGNSGASTTASTISAGSLSMQYCSMTIPITTSGTASIILFYGQHVTTGNTTCLTHGGSGSSHSAVNCYFSSGSASAVSISQTLDMYDCEIESSNTNAITGAGTLNYTNISFVGTSSSTINPTTLVGKVTRPGITRSASQPAFLAYLSANATNQTGDGTLYTVICDGEVYDQNADYNPATGIFTAPYTGRYFLSFSTYIAPGVAGTNIFNNFITTTARTFQSQQGYAVGAGVATSLILTVLANMTAGDTATFQVSAANGTKTAVVAGASSPALTFVSGYLVC